MASSYDRGTQSLRCDKCKQSLPLCRTSTFNPERMVLLAEAFAIKHLGCRTGHERQWRLRSRWAQFFDRQPEADAPRPLSADHGHGVSLA